MEPQKDSASGRHLIEGRLVPIADGVFRRQNQPGIVVDPEKLSNLDWYKNDLDLVLNTNRDLLGFASVMAKKRFPIIPGNQDWFKGQTGNRYSLNALVLNNSVPDAQALYTALLIETRIKADKDGRNVAIVKDKTDGHAVVVYQGKDYNNIYKFDPSNGDKKFTKMVE